MLATMTRAMRTLRFGRVKTRSPWIRLPNVGKIHTDLNLLAGAMHAEAANYPFCSHRVLI
jgi:obg-like ATPase 1